ncbi:YceI family protein [Williamsia soli]|uniref:YceI family protein n=1 Tax=Williamsia soli TaxID=364929 RepID=UPI0027DE6DE3|nr:YceI family protein [Williamsia soli]
MAVPSGSSWTCITGVLSQGRRVSITDMSSALFCEEQELTVLDVVASNPDSVGKYALMTDQSSIEFKGRSLWGLLRVRGRFTDISGHGELFEQGNVLGELIVDSASISTGIGKRDEHLRSPDFFDTARFPLISVNVTGLRQLPSQELMIDVAIWVKGVVENISIPVTVTVVDDRVIHVQAAATIDRTNFGVDANQLGMVSDSVDVSADLRFRKTG